MSDDEKVISLAERRRRKNASGQGAGMAGQEQDTGVSGEAAGGSSTEAVSSTEAMGEPIPGKLTWLHCPSCGTVESTEVFMTGGRQHDVCGALVEEVVVDIDVRAEYTIAAINLERLEAVEQMVAAQRAHYEEYRARLYTIAGREPPLYPQTPEALERLPVAAVDPMGLLVPEALHLPSRRFTPGKPPTEGGTADGNASEGAKPAGSGAAPDSTDGPKSSGPSGEAKPDPSQS